MPNTVERVVSGAMGAAKDVKAGFKGLTGVFMNLMEEHGKVSALIKRVATSNDAAVYARLYPTIRSELLAHENGELKVVYPALAEYPATAQLAAMHAREAGELQAVIAALDTLEYGDVGWMPAFRRLAHLVDRHVEEEESEYFPRGQHVIGEERARQLAAEYEATKHG